VVLSRVGGGTVSGGSGATATTLTTSLAGEGKSGESITVNEGAKAKDTASLSGTNASKATGTVKYKVYADSSCKELVTSAGEVTVSGGSIPSSSDVELSAGAVYYWQAEYSGDSNNLSSISVCSKEILTVKAATSISTSLSGEGESGEELTVFEGTKVKDTATLSGTGSSTATGTVKYKVYADSECKEMVVSAGEVTVSGGSVPASEEKSLNAGAVYYWQAEYSGDSLHQPSANACGKEVLYIQASTNLDASLSGEEQLADDITVVEGAPVKGLATLSGTNSTKATGTAEYSVYADNECSELATSAGEVTVTAGTIPSSSSVELTTGGDYYWQVFYSGDATHKSSKSACQEAVQNVEKPWVISLGESYMSGEGGRWAGNVEAGFASVAPIDALGPSAYFDNGANTAEAVPGCHRSHSAQIYIGALVNIGVSGKNFACSGARFASYTTESKFKPGLDFYSSGGQEGQALMLEDFAKTHRVKMVLVQIGGTNFEFASTVYACVEAYLLFGYCNQNPAVTANFTQARFDEMEQRIEAALFRVQTAMTDAGYGNSPPHYTILVENYPYALPAADDFRYTERGVSDAGGFYRVEAGCPFNDSDADWIHNVTAGVNMTVRNAVNHSSIPGIGILDVSEALKGHRLCETGTAYVTQSQSWHDAGMVDSSEWVAQIFGLPSPTFSKQESFHPNYWGQMALRNCVRQAYNLGSPVGGTCEVAGTGLNAAEEPRMVLEP
jgi:hypothetical protein